MTALTPFPPKAIVRPVMLQRWSWLTFLHWRYDPRVIQRILPNGLLCDTFDGAAWVGLVPFYIPQLNIAGLPSIPWACTFPETNVRTYVRGPDGRTGIFFFTLEAARLLAVLGARLTYRLPYRWATMNVEKRGAVVEYRSRRLPLFGKGETNIAVKIGSGRDWGDFDFFLTARFRLYTSSRGRIAFADIEHKPWPLQSARVLRLNQNLIEMSGAPRESGAPVVHYSDDLLVKIDRLRWL